MPSAELAGSGERKRAGFGDNRADWPPAVRRPQQRPAGGREHVPVIEPTNPSVAHPFGGPSEPRRALQVAWVAMFNLTK